MLAAVPFAQISAFSLALSPPGPSSKVISARPSSPTCSKGPLSLSVPSPLSVAFKDFIIYLFLEKGEGGRKGEKQCVRDTTGCLLHAPAVDLACNPGMCPDQESNQETFSSQAGAQSESHQPGLICGLYSTYHN